MFNIDYMDRMIANSTLSLPPVIKTIFDALMITPPKGDRDLTHDHSTTWSTLQVKGDNQDRNVRLPTLQSLSENE